MPDEKKKKSARLPYMTPTSMSENYVTLQTEFSRLASGRYILIEFTIKSYETKILEDINCQWNCCINKPSLPLVDTVLRGEWSGIRFINYPLRMSKTHWFSGYSSPPALTRTSWGRVFGKPHRRRSEGRHGKSSLCTCCLAGSLLFMCSLCSSLAEELSSLRTKRNWRPWLWRWFHRCIYTYLLPH